METDTRIPDADATETCAPVDPNELQLAEVHLGSGCWEAMNETVSSTVCVSPPADDEAAATVPVPGSGTE